MSSISEKECGICKKAFTPSCDWQRVCSNPECKKEARLARWRDQKRRRRGARTTRRPEDHCDVCMWYYSLYTIKERGLEGTLCPNHLSLITEGIKSLKEVLAHKLKPAAQI